MVASLVGGVLFIQPSKVAAATYYLSPSSGSYAVGATVTATVVIDSAGQAINSGEGSVTFPSDKLQFQSVSTPSSIFTFWTSGPTGSATTVTFGGGLSNPGYTGSGGRVVTITWKALAAGTATVSIKGTKILANDGVGTNVYTGSGSGTFTIGATKSATPTPQPIPSLSITSATHKEGTWSSVANAIFKWSASVPASGYYTAFDQSPATEPAGNLVTATTAAYDNVADGIWYFHVKADSSSSIPVAHFKLQIDKIAPEAFTITADKEDKVINLAPKLIFEAVDSVSGIDRYEASIDGGASFVIKSGETLPKQRPGTHTIIITAYDRAGNTRVAKLTFTLEGISAPIIVKWPPHVNILRPITFVGRAAPTDTIIVTLEGKEVARFVAETRKSNDHGGEISWTYSYTERLYPGAYKFSFQRMNAEGQESESTQPHVVQVHTAALILGAFAVDYAALLIALSILTFFLIAWIAHLLHRRRKREESDPKHKKEKI